MSGIVSKIKISIAEAQLSKKLRKLNRSKKFVHLSEAKTIGIIYNLTDEGMFRKVKELANELSVRQRQVLTVGFVNRKTIPNYCVAADSGYFLNQRDLNWYGAPKNDYVSQFINKELDILIDLSMEETYVLKFICGLSRSRFKVGKYSDASKTYLDFMIDPDKSCSMDEFIEQILHYLTVIKNS
jgi:hypothetical protein